MSQVVEEFGEFVAVGERCFLIENPADGGFGFVAVRGQGAQVVQVAGLCAVQGSVYFELDLTGVGQEADFQGISLFVGVQLLPERDRQQVQIGKVE